MHQQLHLTILLVYIFVVFEILLIVKFFRLRQIQTKEKVVIIHMERRFLTISLQVANRKNQIRAIW